MDIKQNIRPIPLSQGKFAIVDAKDYTLLNQWNRKKTCGKSKYKGVHWLEPNKKWVATITVYRERKYLGIFENEEDAALAYNEASLKYHGKFSNINNLKGLK